MWPGRLIVTGIAVLCLHWCATPGEAQNWPQWRGPEGDSVVRLGTLPLHWSERQGLAWKVELPGWGDSTPAIWNDTIFVTTQVDQDLLLLCLKKQTGAVQWTKTVGKAELKRRTSGDPKRAHRFHDLHNLASPSPVTDGERVIVHFGNGDLVCYNFAGDEQWRHNLEQEHGGYTIWWGHANSPVLFGDLVISVCMQDSQSGIAEKLAPSYLVAHDKKTGAQVWKQARMTGAEAESGDSYTTPLLTTVNQQPLLLVMGGNQVDAYHPQTGAQLWAVPGLVGGRTITGPTIGHGRVYVTNGMRGPLNAVTLSGKGQREKKEAVAWSLEQGTADTCCPVLWSDLLYFVADNGVASCLDAHSGRRLWQERLKGNYKASPLAGNGRIYFLNQQGVCTVITADSRFQKLAENDLAEEFIASPAAADGHLFLRSKKHLFAVGAPW